MTNEIETIINRICLLEDKRVINSIATMLARHDTESIYISRIKPKNGAKYFEVKTYFRGKQEYLGRKSTRKEAEQLKKAYESRYTTITVESSL